jgi:hypothetical protein
MTHSPQVEVGDVGKSVPRIRLLVGVVLLKPLSLIGGEHLSQITSRASTRQALESYCWRRC